VIVGQHLGVTGEDGQVVQQEVAEIAGVQNAQPLLIGAIERRAPAVGEMAALCRRQFVRRPAAVLPLVDQAGQVLGRPALGVNVLRLQKLPDQPFLIVGVDDRVAGF